ncbi:MAG: cyclic nucleotide-binding domain-containing protein, partial [Robiginitalea sp.]
MSNRISERVADFLRRYPPFNELTAKDLLRLSEEIDVVYREKGTYVFRQGEKVHSFFYVVQRGAVELRTVAPNEIVDICDEGDIFGLRPLMAGEDYKLEALVREESLLYAIPIEVFRPYIQTYEEVGNFLIESFASNTRNPYAKPQTGVLLDSNTAALEPRGVPISEILPVQTSKNIISCGPEAPVSEVALLMTKKNVGS